MLMLWSFNVGSANEVGEVRRSPRKLAILLVGIPTLHRLGFIISAGSKFTSFGSSLVLSRLAIFRKFYDSLCLF